MLLQCKQGNGSCVQRSGNAKYERQDSGFAITKLHVANKHTKDKFSSGA